MVKVVNTTIVSEHILSSYADICVELFCLYYAFYIIVKHFSNICIDFVLKYQGFINIRSAGIENVIFVRELFFCVMFSVSDIHDFLFQLEM